jgi:hypothetical protein
MLEAAIWWTGVFVLGVGGAAFAVALIAGTAICATFFANHYAQRFGNLYENLHDLRSWVSAGRPKWAQGDDKVYRMVPSVGAWEE